MKKAADAVKGAFDAAQKTLRSAQDHVIQKKEECKRKMTLECDNCRKLKCKKAQDDCNAFFARVGKWFKDTAKKVGM